MRTQPQTQAQPKYEEGSFDDLYLNQWDDMPKAEKFLVKGLTAGILLAICVTPVGGLVVACASAGYYGFELKPKQDSLVNEYYRLLEKNGGNLSQLWTPPADKAREEEISKAVGDHPHALHNACLLRFS